MRINKYISTSGYCSRRKAEELIRKGLVTLNGEIVKELATNISSGDFLMVEGRAISHDTKEKVYYLLNKPRSVVSTSNDDKGRKTVVDLIPSKERIFPVGRLDYDTTGAIILTNDGDFANLITHPRNKIEKLYIVKINGIPSKGILDTIRRGVRVEDYTTSKAKVKIKSVDKRNNTSILELIIYEGKNHQVKKMLKALGYQVLKLKRERIAFLGVESMNSGEYRTLTVKEVKKIFGEYGMRG